jgi:hypothetical protein
MFMNVIDERVYVANSVINNLLNMVGFFIIESLTRFVPYYQSIRVKGIYLFIRITCKRFFISVSFLIIYLEKSPFID